MKKLFSFYLIMIIILCLIIPTAAYSLGDVDNSGDISAADARLALRASVDLESLAEDAFVNADVDRDGTLTASDARMILRASVGIETLHTHNYGDWEITHEASCTEIGTKVKYCVCGDCIQKSIPMLLHNYTDGVCGACGEYINTNLPKMYFVGNIAEMNTKTDERKIQISYTSKDISFEGFAKIKVQGSSSLSYEKKNYTINLYEDENLEEKMKIDVGWGKQNKYCLKANWIDKTHSRNIVTANIVTEVQQKYGLFEQAPANGAIDGFPIEIYSNGEFLGIYTFNIPKDEWMFNMDKNNPNHIVFCSEAWLPANCFKAEPDFNTWSVEVGQETDETLNKLKELFNFVMNSSDEEFKQNFDEHLNLDATLNYYILADFAYLVDNTGKNLLLATYDGNVWYPSLYDLDTSWGTHWNGKSIYDYKNQPFNFQSSTLWSRLQNLFGEELSARYFELREEILTKEHIMEKFEEFKASIPVESFMMENAKWGTQIPGADISQIEEYLNFIIPEKDIKYSAMIETE